MRSPWGSPQRAVAGAAAATAVAACSPSAPPAFRPGSSGASSLLGGEMFDLSPEADALGLLGALPHAAAQYPPAASGGWQHPPAAVAFGSEADEDEEDDLSLFLEQLKNKYQLAPAPPVPEAAAAAAPGGIRVHVRVTSSAGGGEAAAPPPQQQQAADPFQDGGIPAWMPAAAPPAAGLGTHCQNSTAAARPPSAAATDGRAPAAGAQAAGAAASPGAPAPLAQGAVDDHSPQQQPADAADAPPAEQPTAQPAEEPAAKQEAAGDEEGLLSAEMSAELAALEEMQHRLAEQQAAEQQQQQAEQQQQDLPGAPAPTEGNSAATPAGSTHHEQPAPAAAVPAQQPSQEPSSAPPSAARSQQPTAQQLPWAALHSHLLQRGFPGLLPLGSDAGSAAAQQPDPAALFAALSSLLQEQARSAAQQQRLAEATQAAARREGALVASLTAAAHKRDADIEKWKRLALSNQVAARDAQMSSRQCSHAGEQLAAEARALERDVARLQHALHGKVRGACPWRGNRSSSVMRDRKSVV